MMNVSQIIMLYALNLYSYISIKLGGRKERILTYFVCLFDYLPLFEYFSSVQSLSRVRLFATPWIAARQASLSITSSQSLLRLIPVESVMPSSHLILCHLCLLLPPIPLSTYYMANIELSILPRGNSEALLDAEFVPSGVQNVLHAFISCVPDNNPSVFSI